METNILTPTIRKVKNLELFLLHLRYREGHMLSVEGNKPLLLDDPESAWIVYSGTVDVFSVPVVKREVAGTRTHLFRSEAGQLLMGISDTQSDTALLVSGTPGTRVIQLKRSRLSDLSDDAEYETTIVSMINDWVTGLSMGVFNKLLPKEYTLVEPDPGLVLTVDELTTVTPKRGVAWLNVREGEGRIVGEEHVPISRTNDLFPLAQFVWWRPIGGARISVWDTGTVLAQKIVWGALNRFHQIVLDTINLTQEQAGSDEWERIRRKAESEELIMENALLRLGSALGEDVTFLKALETGHDAIWEASLVVAKGMDIELTAPPAGVSQGLTGFELLEKIVQFSRIRTREVALRDDWWQKDNGPLLGFTKENQPVALMPTKGGRGYEMIDPIKKVRVSLTTTHIKELNTLAYTFYRPFPNEELTAGRLLKFGLQNSWGDLRIVVAVGVVLGLLRLLPPIATGFIFNTYIPQANVNGLVQVGIGLIVMALCVGLLQIAQGNALLRLQSRLDTSLQAALWDRLLTLPIPFFRQFSSGDLGTRVMGISTIRRILSGYVFTTILTFLFTSFNLVLLFFYSPILAFLAVGLVVAASLVIGFFTSYDIRHQRELSTSRGGLSGLVLQLLTGIAKLRITASENQAFALWADKFVEQNKLYYRARSAANRLATFNSIYPVLCSLAIFAVVGYSSNRAGLSTGNFLAFNLAFVQFLSAWIAMANCLTTVAGTVPLYERLMPILGATPEVDEVKITPPPLTGAIEVNHVSFRYKEKGPLVLKDISLSIQAGQFVAFVGASGSGKTTLMRLLLLFDMPESGGIYYDGQDLRDLDAREVRRQLGVVLQNSALMSGSIYENIVGASNLTVDAAWAAARMVGLDADIEEMPMKMNTVISGAGSTLSGGQRQRIMIARAIVSRPRIVLFDEATSALDNKTQEIVSRSLEGLQATRIVIAHRLSTIINADKIFVFDKGEIVQAGTYDELIRQPGPFAELAKRQTV